jgi:Fe-S oxidoreductase
MPEPAPLLIDDALWERLIELTGGAAASCYQCGTCTAICPWGLVRQEHLSVRTLMHKAQIGLFNGNADLWLCTTCAQCEAQCPRGVKISEVFRGLRALAWERREVEGGLPSLLWSVFWNQNPWSQPPSRRADWSKGIEMPIFDPGQHEILLYIGCTSSYDWRAQKIARALVQVLNVAGVSFGYLGYGEPCCGESVLSLGHKPYFQEIAEHTARLFREKGISRLVAISPHCYDVFKNYYPLVNEEFQPVHYTQYLAELIEQGRLKFGHTLKARITFQDPCYLGRHNGEYGAPRRVLFAIPGVELVEMPKTRADGLCCGGGGGRLWLETMPGERFSDLRVQEASQTGAQTLATACPFCIVCLEDSAKVMRLEHLRTLDVAEIAAMALAG